MHIFPQLFRWARDSLTLRKTRLQIFTRKWTYSGICLWIVSFLLCWDLDSLRHPPVPESGTQTMYRHVRKNARIRLCAVRCRFRLSAAPLKSASLRQADGFNFDVFTYAQAINVIICQLSRESSWILPYPEQIFHRHRLGLHFAIPVPLLPERS